LAGMSDFEADGYLNGRYRSTAPAVVGTAYVALLSGDPGRSYSAALELAATGGYARVPITKGDAAWSAPATVGGKRQIANAALVNFGTASGTWNGGAVIGFFAIMDSPTIGAGSMLGSGAIQAPKAVGASDPVSFPVGALTVRA